MTLSTKIEVFTDFTFVRSGPSYMHCCHAFPLRLLLSCTPTCAFKFMEQQKQATMKKKQILNSRPITCSYIVLLHFVPR